MPVPAEEDGVIFVSAGHDGVVWMVLVVNLLP